MRKVFLAVLFCFFTAITTQAEPFVILPSGELAFNTAFTTTGTFTCSACTGSGTNSVVFGSGGNTVTLTFTGVDTTVLVGAGKVPTSLGQIQVVASGSGFVFPIGSNPSLPVITLNLGINQTSPTVGGAFHQFVAFGGGTSLNFVPLFSDHDSLPTGPNPPGFSYTAIVYTYNNFTIPNTSAVVNVNADLSAVPEPASVLLLTSGAGMMITLLRKRRSKR